MEPQDTIDLSRNALTMVAALGGPILIAGVVIGLVVGVFQAMTQIQDQTISIVPKLGGMLLVALLLLPWLSEKMVDFTRESLERPMIGGQHWTPQTASASPTPIAPEDSRKDPLTDSKPIARLASAARSLPPVRLPAATTGQPSPALPSPAPASMPMLRAPRSSMPIMKRPAPSHESTPAGPPADQPTPFQQPHFRRPIKEANQPILHSIQQDIDRKPTEKKNEA